MDDLVTLVPFTVIPQPILRTYDELAGLSLDDGATYWSAIYYLSESQVIDKEWLVVGVVGNERFLIVRDGEIAHWWPREFCKIAKTTPLTALSSP